MLVTFHETRLKNYILTNLVQRFTNQIICCLTLLRMRNQMRCIHKVTKNKRHRNKMTKPMYILYCKYLKSIVRPTLPFFDIT